MTTPTPEILAELKRKAKASLREWEEHGWVTDEYALASGPDTALALLERIENLESKAEDAYSDGYGDGLADGPAR